MEKRWQKSEIAHLERHAATKSVDELAQRFKTDAATVRRKLEELGLASGGSAAGSDEEAIAFYEKALEQLYGGHWKKAAELFEKMSGATDGRQLRDRAQQLLKVCHEKLEGTPKAEDDYDQVVFDKNRGELGAALEVAEKHAKKDPDGRYTYLLASLQALSGSEDEALETLEKAIEIDPRNRVHAYHDPDFESLRGREELDKLLAVG